MNPLVMRVISVFDSKVEDNVNFKQFATTLSVFHRQADPVEKMNCMKYFSIEKMIIYSTIKLNHRKFIQICKFIY